jgi:hypothetical protein
MELGGECHAPADLLPKMMWFPHCMGSWVGPGAGQEGAENLDCRPVQSVASRCAHYAILAQRGNNALKFDGMGGVGVETLVTVEGEGACPHVKVACTVVSSLLSLGSVVRVNKIRLEQCSDTCTVLMFCIVTFL